MYSFEMTVEERPALLIFSGSNQGTDIDYGDSIDRTLKFWTGSYSVIIFIVPKYLENIISNYIYQNERFVSNITRYGINTNVKFFSFNGFAELEKFYEINNSFDFRVDNKTILELIIFYGMNNLVRKRSQEIILTAPPGTTFKKPSNDEFIEFIKASELAVGCDENLFVAFSLLSKRPKDIAIKKIYIDSSSIAAYIVAIISYIREFSGNKNIEICYYSFNSYDGLDSSQPDYKDDVWVIISASTSNNLGKKILKKWKGLKHCQIITLLSYKNSEVDEWGQEIGCGDRIVSNIYDFSTNKNIQVKTQNLIPIKIIGENFTAQIDPPALVVLKKSHLPASAKDFLIEASKVKLFSLNKSDKRRTKNIYFNADEYFNCSISDGFFKWLKSVAVWNIPYGIKYVIFETENQYSNIVFNNLKSVLPSEVESLDINHINEKNLSDCSVIVLSPVVSSGRIFLKANRDLRMAEHSGPRIFICACGLFKSQSAFSLFEKSLLQAPGPFKYKFFSYKTIFIGNTDSVKIWERELSVVESLKSNIFEKRAEVLRNRLEGIPQGIGISFDEGGLPLQFNKHFAFWGVEYSPEEISHSSVYLTISSVLQSLRDRPAEEEDSLYHHVYKHAVIDPENFSRFNEGVIQASLWRAAEDIEVNYKYLPDESSTFHSILLNLAKDTINGNSNGLADLLLGVAMEKIQLHEKSINIIARELKDLTKEYSAIQEIISYIESFVLTGIDPATTGTSF